jgi:hypothetical protein
VEVILLTTAMVVVIVGILVLIGHAYPGSGADLLDWKPTRDYETELELERDDISQMLAAQNEYRRKRGASEITALDAERMAQEDNRVRSRSRGLDQESLDELDRELRDREDAAPAEPADPATPSDPKA